MNQFVPNCLPTSVGSLPHTDPVAAFDLILKYSSRLPAWPQLPKRDPVERIYAQYLGAFPGAVAKDDRVIVRREEAYAGLEALYADHLADATTYYELAPERASGLAELRRRFPIDIAQGVKGQVIGPLSAALQTTDEELRPLLYDEVLVDALAKYLRLIVRAHEHSLSQLCARTIVILDEPFLGAVGSGLVHVDRVQATNLLRDVLDSIDGLKGIHCCDNADWSLAMSLPIDILSFDAYSFGETLTLYPNEVKDFVRRGGTVAWGIVPTEPAALAKENVDSLIARLTRYVDLLGAKGVDNDAILAASLITPSCGLGTLTVDVAERAMALTAEVSERMRTTLKN